MRSSKSASFPKNFRVASSRASSAFGSSSGLAGRTIAEPSDTLSAKDVDPSTIRDVPPVVTRLTNIYVLKSLSSCLAQFGIFPSLPRISVSSICCKATRPSPPGVPGFNPAKHFHMSLLVLIPLVQLDQDSPIQLQSVLGEVVNAIVIFSVRLPNGR